MITTWTTDPKDILIAINALIDDQTQLILLRGQAPSCPTRAIKIHVFRGLPYLILHRPPEVQSHEEIITALFKLHGLPILGFPCTVVKGTPQLLAALVPRELFQLELRQENRFTPRQGSMATFFLESRAQVNICKLENLSTTGAKLVGIQSKLLDQGDHIGPCTLALAGRNQLVSHELTLPLAKVVRTQPALGQKGVDVGIQFTLGKEEERQLQKYLELLDSYPPSS